MSCLLIDIDPIFTIFKHKRKNGFRDGSAPTFFQHSRDLISYISEHLLSPPPQQQNILERWLVEFGHNFGKFQGYGRGHRHGFGWD